MIREMLFFTLRLTTWKESKSLWLARKTLKRLGIHGWSVKLDNSHRVAGRCYHEIKTIVLSRRFINHPTCSMEEIENTILHEIAHAIAGYKEHHGPEWKRIARMIGCTGDRCTKIQFDERIPKYVLRCTNPDCTNIGHRHKIPSKIKAGAASFNCGRCKSKMDVLVVDKTFRNQLYGKRSQR